MTIERAPGSIEAVVIASLHRLSDAEVEAFTGRSKSYWYRVSHPGKSERLGFNDAALLDAASISREEPARFHQLLGDLTASTLRRHRGETRQATALKDGLARLVVETGELASALSIATADGKVTPAERRSIADEAQHVIDEATRIRDAAIAVAG